jgi:hypothetical protein
MKWHFSPQLPDQVETEITQRDQFNNDDVDISETIVREAIQNSLDAAIDEPCRVKVSFRWLDKASGLDPTFFRSLFDGQLHHAEAAEIDVSNLDFENPKALIIEDFGTCGLTGDVAAKDNDNFSDFWRRHGKSHKTGKSRGRWGLGKLVYSTTSQIGVFFGATRRKDDTAVYIMGQTVLNLRKVNDKEYPPHAFFADLDNAEDIYKRIPVPVKDKELIHNFTENFSLERGDQTGLSVIIPFPNPVFNIQKMIGVAMANYFYPLITGQLVLDFDGISINRENVREMIKQYAADRFDQIDILFDFIEEIYQAEKEHLLKLKPSWIDDRKLDADDFDSETLTSIRKSFSAGELVALYLPVTLKLKNGTEKNSGFSVYIKRPSELTKGIDLYVRGGLTLPGEAKFRDRRALGAMIAEDEDICSFLGDAENAAHTQWTTNTEKLRRNYRSSQPIVTVIKKSVLQLYDLLAEVIEDKDEDVLLDFFWFKEPESNAKKRKKKHERPLVVPPIKQTPPLLNLSPIHGGFTITNTDNFTKDMLPREVRIEAAYDVSRGNPFKKYSPHDFKVGSTGSVTVTNAENVKTVSAKENKWIIEISDLPFKFTAAGFDENRDVRVKTT